MLTKEELEQYRLDCVLALTKLSYNAKGHYIHNLSGEIKLLEQLIEEHFKLIKCDLDCKNCWKFKLVERYHNQPLKFEELKEGDWVWDEKEKWWRNIVIVFEPCNEYPLGSLKAWANSDETSKDFIEFEENRFYRKQVLDE